MELQSGHTTKILQGLDSSNVADKSVKAFGELLCLWLAEKDLEKVFQFFVQQREREKARQRELEREGESKAESARQR